MINHYSPDDIIILSDKQPFGMGNDKAVYCHPHHNHLCLKVIRPGVMEARMKLMRKQRFFRSLIRSESYYNFLDVEYRSYLAVVANGSSLVLRHLPKYYGFVQTDIGRALSVELITNDDGSIVSTLEQEIIQLGLTDSLQTAIVEWTEVIRDDCYSSYVFYELNNLLVKRSKQGIIILDAEYVSKRQGRNMFASIRNRKKRTGVKNLWGRIEDAVALHKTNKSTVKYDYVN